MLPIIQLLLVLACLYFCARRGGVALGVISGIGLAILVLGFQMKPGSPPTTVIYIIIAAVTTAGSCLVYRIPGRPSIIYLDKFGHFSTPKCEYITQ